MSDFSLPIYKIKIEYLAETDDLTIFINDQPFSELEFREYTIMRAKMEKIHRFLYLETIGLDKRFNAMQLESQNTGSM